ncbi:MAG: aldehyde dehydrogenase family protein, partial [Anaerolineae bacterium]
MSQELWIGGEFVAPASDETIEVLNPYTEEVIGHAAAGTPADVDRAVQAAERAFAEWRWIPAVERADYLHEVARKLRKEEKAIARQLTLEGGKPLVENLDEVGW